MSTLLSQPIRRPTIPRLESGDRLSRDEFRRRYEAMPGVKAELIEGIVHMASPVRWDGHGFETSLIVTWLTMYYGGTPGVFPADNATTRLNTNNEPQPDGLLFIHPRNGGQTKLVDGYIEGAPELAVEVASSSVSIDVHAKLRAYQKAGVREYVIWRTQDGEVDWLALDESGAFVPRPRDADGVCRSGTLPGLWLDVPALLAGDILRVVETLNRGLATPDHAAFVERLAAHASAAAPAE